VQREKKLAKTLNNVKFLFIKKVLEIKNDYQVKWLYSFCSFAKKGSLENLNREKFGSFLRIFRTKLIIKSNYQNNTLNFLIIIMLSSSNVAFAFKKKNRQ
jgi:hypothetical protein